MGFNDFSTGRDNTIQIVTPRGALRPELITEFDAKPTVAETSIKGMDGLVRHQNFHEGWSGSCKFDRRSAVLDKEWAQQESDYYAGLRSGDSYIIQTIQELDGSVSKYRFTAVTFNFTDPGNWKGSAPVNQTLTWKATRRIKIA